MPCTKLVETQKAPRTNNMRIIFIDKHTVIENWSSFELIAQNTLRNNLS